MQKEDFVKRKRRKYGGESQIKICKCRKKSNKIDISLKQKYVWKEIQEKWNKKIAHFYLEDIFLGNITLEKYQPINIVYQFYKKIFYLNFLL